MKQFSRRLFSLLLSLSMLLTIVPVPAAAAELELSPVDEDLGPDDPAYFSLKEGESKELTARILESGYDFIWDVDSSTVISYEETRPNEFSSKLTITGLSVPSGKKSMSTTLTLIAKKVDNDGNEILKTKKVSVSVKHVPPVLPYMIEIGASGAGSSAGSDKDNPYKVYEGDRFTLSATVYGDKDGKTLASDQSVEWSIDKTGVATISGANVTIANPLGTDEVTAIITATANTASSDGKKKTQNFYILAKQRTYITITESKGGRELPDFDLGVGHTFTPSVTVTPLAMENGLIWKSTSPTIASVDDDGTITGIAPGSAIISATTKDGQSDTVTVNVYQPAQSIEKSDDDDDLLKQVGQDYTSGGETTKVYTVGKDDSIKLNPNIVPDLASVEWSAEPAGFLTVSNSGNVTGKKVKLDAITVTVSGRKDTVNTGCEPPSLSYKVRVISAASGVKVAPLNCTVGINGTAELTAAVSGASSGQTRVTWSSSDDKIVEVLTSTAADTDTGGTVSIKGLAPGEATVTATTLNGQKADCKVSVVVPIDKVEIISRSDNLKLTELSSIPSSLPADLRGSIPSDSVLFEGEVNVGGHPSLGVTLTPPAGIDIPPAAQVIWTSSSSAIATISDGGLVNAKNSGRTIINATVNTISADGTPVVKRSSLILTVNPISIQSVSLDGLDVKDGKKVASVGLNSSLQLKTVITPSDTSNKNLSWKSSDETVAAVKNGRITPVKTGTATITVTSDADNSKSDSCLLTVTAAAPTGVVLTPRDPVTLEVDGKQTFTAVLTPSGADGTVTFGVSSTEILSTSWAENKVLNVTAKKPGEATVAVKLGTFEASTKVTVSGIVLDKTALSLTLGKTASVTKKLYGSAKTMNAKGWLWSSENDEIARVNESSGLITGVKAGTTNIVCKHENNSKYAAKIAVTVSEAAADVIHSSLNDEKELDFSTLTSTINDKCNKNFSSSLDYVTNLTVSPSQGILYYGYVSPSDPGQGVAASDRFYYQLTKAAAAAPGGDYLYGAGGPMDKELSKVSFVPAAGFSGNAEISYTAYAENGKDLVGTVEVKVGAPTELRYDSPNGEAVRFHSNDFTTLSNAKTGYPISSVRFNAPSERYGYLYFDYAGGPVYGSNINSTQKYYASSTPALDKVAFVPRSDFTGTVPITFTAWNTNGVSFTGNIRITVKSTGESGSGDITYKTYTNKRVYFDVTDFQALCKTATGATLNYVRFTLPDATDNYYLYVGDGTNRVQSDTDYYASGSGSTYLNNVNLLPREGFAGSIAIPFKGYTKTSTANPNAKTFEGTVVVNVTKDGGSASTINLTCTGMPLFFRRADFDEACKGALSDTLKSVRFSLPADNSGTIYAHFNDLNDRTPLKADKDIPAGELVTLSYLPRGENSGTVYLSYTATDEKGNACDGQVRISIEPGTASQYFTDVDSVPWAVPSINFLRSYGVVTGRGKKRYMPNDTLKRGDFVLMLSRAFNFKLVGSESFPDVDEDSYYAGAIAAAKALGLVKGAGKKGSFRPDENITRQEAATILYRVLVDEKNLSTASSGYLDSFSDRGQIESYAIDPLATLVRDGIFEGSGGQLYPYAPLTRAQMAVILHRAIT